MQETEVIGKQLPDKKFSAGAITATIWKNNGTSKRTGLAVEYNTIKLDRNYKNKEGTWQSTSSLRLNDLQKAALLLNKAYEHLVLRRQDAPNGSFTTSYNSEEEELVI